jgi:peroxiredoxin
MIEEGSQAPTFELPAVCGGEFEQVALSSHLDDGSVVLAFYPGDFNPACTDERTDLDELDLFTMQKDVTILGISADSVYSHRAFAAEYDLHVPLLSDARGEVAQRYGVTVGEEDAGHLTRRAVVVIGPTGTVEYTWVTDDIEALPDVDEVRAAIQEVGGDKTAEARYRVGHAHYIEGRRAFTSAMEAFEEKEWMLAKADFDRAETEFEEAHDEFNTAVRFTPEDRSRPSFEAAERKAEALWRASGWLRDSANAFASGEGAAGDSMRRDAETPLETAKGIDEPPSPDNLPTDGESIEPDGDTAGQADGEISLDIDLDPADSTGADAADAGTGAEDSAPIEDRTATAGSGRESTTGSDADDAGSVPDSTAAAAADDDSAAAAEADSEPAPGSGEEPVRDSGEEPSGDQDDEIDEEELEAIAAELEEQTEAARQEHSDSPDRNTVVPSSIDVDPSAETDVGELTPVESQEPEPGGSTTAADDASDSETVELDLADPEDSEADDADSEADDADDEGRDSAAGSLDSGDHGVPDSL